MNLAILALFSGSNIGIEITIYFLISHGILSSGLFILIGI
jgi:NADH:ubiquinone oxidoreductase subunit 4 (subunit M)